MTTRPPHTCTEHQAGSHACYRRHQCRCEPCATKANRDKKGYALKSPLVSAMPVRAHIAHLIARGLTEGGIAYRAGTTQSHIHYLVRTAKRLHPDIAGRILAIRPVEPGGLVSAVATRRRIEALMAMGWPASWLAARLGLSRAAVSHWLDNEQVHWNTAERARRLYDELWNVPPPATTRDQRGAVARTKRLAEIRRWAPPMAWDDDSIADPAARPQHNLPGRETTVEKVEWLAEADLELPGIEMQLGIDREAIYKACHREQRLDLWQRITRSEAA